MDTASETAHVTAAAGESAPAECRADCTLLVPVAACGVQSLNTTPSVETQTTTAVPVLTYPAVTTEESTKNAGEEVPSATPRVGSKRSRLASKDMKHGARSATAVARTEASDVTEPISRASGSESPALLSSLGKGTETQHQERGIPRTLQCLLADASTPKQVRRLRQTLLSIFPAHLQPFITSREYAAEGNTSARIPSARVAATRQRASRAAAGGLSTDDGGVRSVTSHAPPELLEELLPALCQDIHYVHCAWRRYQEDATYIKSKGIHSADHHNTLYTQPRKNTTDLMEKDDGMVGGGEVPGKHTYYTLEHATCDIPTHRFRFKVWQDSETTKASGIRSPQGLISMEDVLSETELQRYARYGMSSGRLRHECVEPFQFLTGRVVELRRRLGG